ncbi:hypothetical protein L614_001800000040 [Ochrobactrum sp. J50]|uniref:hypothetical protein n=1 Tax=Ochrobactrum sp. J50 TaxID=936132 RepID=UPI0011A8DFDA|nr:hypothetical protein [Ochrobactrum sp. J50]TWH02470.1 hypothetical protein L614_001800000040 [Ochrobactrum sp. J50]
MKLTKRHLRALKYLATVDGFALQRSTPDGNGHTSTGGASSATMSDLKTNGLVNYGKEPWHSLYGYRITEAGRAALRERGQE